MAKRRKTQRKAAGSKPKTPGGFWDRTAPGPAIISVRAASSRLARTAAFLLRMIGLGRKNG